MANEELIYFIQSCTIVKGFFSTVSDFKITIFQIQVAIPVLLTIGRATWICFEGEETGPRNSITRHNAEKNSRILGFLLGEWSWSVRLHSKYKDDNGVWGLNVSIKYISRTFNTI